MTPISVESRWGVCVLRCEGPGGYEGLGEQLAELHERAVRHVVLDVDECPMPPAVVKLLKAESRRFHDDGGELVLAVENDEARVTLARAGLMRPAPALAPGEPLTGASATLAAEPLWQHEFTFPAEARRLGAARRRVVASAEVAGLHGAPLFELSVAIAEALTNAVVHGSPNGAGDDVTVSFFCYEDEVAVEVRDSGRGIDASPICAPPPTATRGRGIHFMRALTDGVLFSCGPLGTRVFLIKRKG